MRFRQLRGWALVVGLVAWGACSSPETEQLESTLKLNLETIRTVIAQFRGDAGHYPPDLGALVERGFLRRIPRDPLTKSTETWIVVRETVPDGGFGGVVDVRSGAPGLATDGTSYRDW